MAFAQGNGRIALMLESPLNNLHLLSIMSWFAFSISSFFFEVSGNARF